MRNSNFPSFCLHSLDLLLSRHLDSVLRLLRCHHYHKEKQQEPHGLHRPQAAEGYGDKSVEFVTEGQANVLDLDTSLYVRVRK